jgi:CHAD domain-containing protein
VSARFELQPGSPGARGVRDILHRQLETALAELPRTAPTDEQIHTARKHVKAARATLRLLRPLLTETAYRGGNRTLRDAARALSAARDDSVLLKTLSELAQQTSGAGKRRRLAALRADLQYAARRRRTELARHGLRHSAACLRSALTMVDSWPTPPQHWPPIYASLCASYRTGRRCARRNSRSASGPALHEWRKRAKYLRNQLEVIAPVQHASVEAMAARLHKLADHLGEEHDLAVLGELARRRKGLLGRKADSALQKKIEQRRRKMCERALSVGLPIYAEKPARFEKRLRRYFKHWS